MDTIPLSPIDHVFTGIGSYPIEFVFAYPAPMAGDRLGESLRKTLEHFPAVRTRLVRLSAAAYGLEPSDEGCVFEVVDSPTTFADSEARHAFVNPVETVEGQPLARVQLTQTPDGAVLGVSLSHAVVDGFSYFHFLSSWSRVFHGKPVVAAPRHREEFLSSAPDPGALRLTPEAVREGCGLFWSERRRAIRRDPAKSHRHLLSSEALGALLGRAQQGCDVRLSHNDVITAWLWQTYVSEWAAPQETTAFASCPVDVRRLLPRLPPAYFGCAVALATIVIERDRLRDAPLGELARRVRDGVARINGDAVGRCLSTIDRLVRQEGLEVLESCHVVHPRSGILVTNLSRLPLREIEFDAGPPVDFDILTPAERCAVVLPAADGVDVRVYLPAC